MRRRFRSATPPLLAILVLSAGITGCDTEAKRQRRQAEEDLARRQAETEPPTPEVLTQLRTATDDFMKEHHPGLQVEGCTFTSLTPNLFLIGVSVYDVLGGNTRYVKQLTGERMRDVEDNWLGESRENGQLLWIIDYADEQKMKTLADRHGFAHEVDAVRDTDPRYDHGYSWGHRSWLDDYLLWHYVFHRPSPMAYGPGMGFRPMPMGYRFHDPGHPIQAEDARAFQAAAAPTGGRSSVFLGGSAWRPPLVSQVSSIPGQAFSVSGSHISGKASMGSVSRGGFGASGHAAGGAHGS